MYKLPKCLTPFFNFVFHNCGQPLENHFFHLLNNIDDLKYKMTPNLKAMRSLELYRLHQS